jgi:hypothetical protein
VRDCQVGLTCQKRYDHMVTPERSPSLLSLSVVTHVEWIVNGEVFIPLSFTSIFLCGTNELVPGFISDSSGRWPLSFLPFSFLFL